MKLISLVPYTIFPAKVGGQKGIALFNQYLSQREDLTMVTVETNDPSFAAYRVLNVIKGGAMRYIHPRNYYLLKGIIRRSGATHLVLEHPYWGWLGVLLRRQLGIHLTVHSHNIEATRWRSLGKWWWRILKAYERFTHRHADMNFFIHDEDRAYAVREFGLRPERCTTITYGIEWPEAPSREERMRCAAQVRAEFGLSESTRILLFNGALDYLPNHQAVLNIINEVNPRLMKTDLDYRIIICGRKLSPELDQLRAYRDSGILYAGFVDDITVFFKGADLFINPVTEGGGIKTKLVEAIGYGTSAASTVNGAIGVSKEIAGDKLSLTADGDWDAFAWSIVETATLPYAPTPASFYSHFYWGNIARKAAAHISGRHVS